jgi:hypothetical protein
MCCCGEWLWGEKVGKGDTHPVTDHTRFLPTPSKFTHYPVFVYSGSEWLAVKLCGILPGFRSATLRASITATHAIISVIEDKLRC